MSKEVQQVSNPLTLVLNIKSSKDALEVQKYLANPETKAKIRNAMIKIGTVHFARFVFLSELELAVITSYDGDFKTYIQAFSDNLEEIFNKLLQYMHDTQGLIPVSENLKSLLNYIKRNDRSYVGGKLQQQFCAYPTLYVYDILACQDGK